MAITLQNLRAALHQNCLNTIDLTSKGAMIQRGAPPALDKLLMQQVANQVTIMQALDWLLQLLGEVPVNETPERKDN